MCGLLAQPSRQKASWGAREAVCTWSSQASSAVSGAERDSRCRFQRAVCSDLPSEPVGSRGPGNGDVATRLGRVGDARSRRRAGAADDRTANRRLHPAVQPPGSTAPPSARAHGCVHNLWSIMRTAPKSVRGLDSSFRERAASVRATAGTSMGLGPPKRFAFLSLSLSPLLQHLSLHALLHRYQVNHQKAHPAPVFLLLSAMGKSDKTSAARRQHESEHCRALLFPSPLREKGGGRNGAVREIQNS